MRWDTDTVGRGVASGRRALAELDRLRDALAEPDWIAEAPEAHLLAHISRAAAAQAAEIVRTAAEPDLFTVHVRARAANRRGLRELAFALVGSIAEASTLVREQPTAEGVAFDVATGMLSQDSEFAPHGHLVRLLITVPTAGDTPR
jgi:hypothetical protein